VINRQGAGEIRVIGRNTQGVRLITLDDGDELVDVARVISEDADPLEVAENGGSESARSVGAAQIRIVRIDSDGEIETDVDYMDDIVDDVEDDVDDMDDDEWEEE
jgi:DNA gyrase subunit A